MQGQEDAIVQFGLLLQSVTSNPGWHCIQVIIEEMCKEANDNLIHFEGWDKDQIAALQARAKTAYEFRDGLYKTIQLRIQRGESQNFCNLQAAQFSKPDAQASTDADELREKALKLFDLQNPVRQDDGRPAGTYVTLKDGTRY